MSETKGDYTFEHFSTSVTGRLSIMLSTKESIPNGTMVRLWNRYREEIWFLDSLSKLHSKTVNRLSMDMMVTLGSFLDLRRIFTDKKNLFAMNYDKWFHCFYSYQEMIKQPQTIPLPFAKAINLRWFRSDCNKTENTAYFLKEQAARILQQSVIPEFYKYYMFTYDQYLDCSMNEKSENFLNLSSLMKYRPVHPLLLQKILSNCFQFVNMIQAKQFSSVIFDHNVLNKKQIDRIANNANLKVGFFLKVQPVYCILETILNPGRLSDDPNRLLDRFPHVWCGLTENNISLHQILENIPRMKARTITKIKNQIDRSPFIVPLPVSMFGKTKDKWQYVQDLNQRTGHVNKKASKLVAEMVVGQRADTISHTWTYEELIWYQLLPSMVDKKVCAWLQSDNQTRRRLLKHDGI